jgi:hypothetical protein
MMARLCLVALAVMLPSVSAWAACEKLPAPVTQYLQSDPQWRLVGMQDLVSSDQILWREARGNLCPGFATVNLEDGKQPAYALALLNRAPVSSRQKIVVLRAQASGYSSTTLVSPRNILFTRTPAVSVVWRSGPGIYREFYSGKPTRLAHDAIMVEQLEATATAHYLANGKFQNILTSD